MEGFLGALIVAIITTFVQWRIAKKDRESKEKERYDKFRLAALEKRLEIHQEAFYRWSKIIYLRFEEDPAKKNFLFDCQEWYYKNCLYLETNSRLEFIRCVNNVFEYKNYWENWRNSIRGSKEYENANTLLKDIFAQIQKTGEIIAKGIDIDFKNVKDFDKELKLDK